MKKRLLAATGLVVMILAAAAAPSCQSGYSGPVEPVTFGMEATAVNSLVYIAAERGYFAANGLNITIRDNYPSGSAAVDGMVKGEVDFASAAETAIVRQAFAGESIRVVASTDKFIHMYLTGRKDRGIQNVMDLKGKRVGVPLNTAADFMFGRFLNLKGMTVGQMTIVDVQAPQALDAISNGDVDAVVTWQPNVMDIQDRLGGNATSWSVQSGQPIYCTLVTTDAWANKHPALTTRFLKALKEAEDYLVRNPGPARAAVQARLHYDDRYIQTIWPEHQFSLALDQSLVLAMEDQARWMIKNNLTGEKQVPDFGRYVHTEDLKALIPGAVNIVR